MPRKAATEQTPEQKAAAKAEREAKKANGFVALAEKRVSKAIQALRLLEPMANKNNYSYTPEQCKAIFTTLDTVLQNVAAKFQPTSKEATASGFSLAAAVAEVTKQEQPEASGETENQPQA